MLHMLQNLITKALDDGILKIPPPISSRVYQTISRGFVNLLNAKKITDTKFPFPYANIIATLLMFHAVLTPLQVSIAIQSKVLAAVFTFIPVWSLFALNFAAGELEDPFGTDANDLPLAHFQEEMNRCLLTLLHPNADLIPNLSDDAVTDFEELVRITGDPPKNVRLSDRLVPSRQYYRNRVEAKPEPEAKAQEAVEDERKPNVSLKSAVSQ